VDVNLPVKLEELFLQARPAVVPPPIFRAFQEMCEDVLRTKVRFFWCNFHNQTCHFVTSL
jgi:hypothetical protein